ncbi:sensor histidine kinase [Noviherbaspirillum pedocola]|uniref:Histidine kinase n=1 Tax=Noviherbaspirillum pedocola TaxID=2801341 RepID=A0A934SRH5_9BURK|nr:histidine kinase [Noviherbaspirillum pedocola]MBK4733806.1 histidine kinase [Noviherbaspirillum pedocola]
MKNNKLTGGIAVDVSDALLIARVRLVLAVSALLTAFIEMPHEGMDLSWMVFCGYALHTATLYVLTQLRKPFTGSELIHWLDVCWYALMVLSTGGSQSLFFPFFFFAILTASFRWGFDEGCRVVVACAALYFAIGIATNASTEVPRLLLRDAFTLGLGYMIAYWGESEIALKRRLALLRDVSRLSNPRFGVDHTITTVLEKTREFFRADNCILVSRDVDSADCSYRAVRSQGARSARAERIGVDIAAPMLALARGHAAVYDGRPPSLLGALAGIGGLRLHDAETRRWNAVEGEDAAGVAELLDADQFISAPVPLRNGEGRLYIASRRGGFSRNDALFLSQLAAQAFPVIENIALLDRMATEAAAEERRRIARDLHDTTIQPYIGLELCLHAMRKKAGDDNPLIEDLDRLTEMGGQVIQELRRYAGSIRNPAIGNGSTLQTTLRRQAEQMSRFYGIDIDLGIEGALDLSDRLSAEIFQMISEGYANIRKHTCARRAWLKLRDENHCIGIEIGNECMEASPAFTPRSLSERAAALGGQAWVDRAGSGCTVVRIEIPI